ncbi:MAG: hypothetical protein ACLPVI_09435 [Dehalococcoidales bacterium]
MFLVTTVVYPPDKSIVVAEKFIEVTAKPLPPFMKRLQVLGDSKMDQGVKILSVYEVEDARIKDGIIELTKMYVQFNGIEGFKYEIETMLTAQESLAVLGFL